MWLSRTESFKQLLQLLLHKAQKRCSQSKQINKSFALKGLLVSQTLNREPIEENFDVLDESSTKEVNKPETKEQFEALKSA